VRGRVNALAAYIFDITIGREQEPCAPKRGEGYDSWHIISASTADAFTTFDCRISKAYFISNVDLRNVSADPSLAGGGIFAKKWRRGFLWCSFWLYLRAPVEG
jgi:hypothetical protein